MPVLEIGPGMGVLTRFLLEAGHDLTVVELDGESVDFLRRHFPELEGRILAEDFLRLDLGRIFPGIGRKIIDRSSANHRDHGIFLLFQILLLKAALPLLLCRMNYLLNK